jgi:hypothetical protein
VLSVGQLHGLDFDDIGRFAFAWARDWWQRLDYKSSHYQSQLT